MWSSRQTNWGTSDQRFSCCLTADALCSTRWRTQLQMKDGDVVASFLRACRRGWVSARPSRSSLVLCSAGLCVWSSSLLITSWHGARQLCRWTPESVSRTLMLTAVVENCYFTNWASLLLGINDVGLNISVYTNYPKRRYFKWILPKCFSFLRIFGEMQMLN